MQWIYRGRQIGQAVKNVQRLRQIIAVFARYGFEDIVTRIQLQRFLPSRIRSARQKDQTQISPAQRLRQSFEDLGPTFVKLGQLLSTRPDLIPENFIEEFTKLQDNVAPLPFETIRKAIEKELNCPLTDAFSEFSPEPLASASIAQVHEAKLKTGEQVVVKVQRPGIEPLIRSDISILAFLARLLERYVPETRMMGPSTVVQEFFRTLTLELDFYVEANNIAKISHNFESLPEIVIPRVYKDLSTHRILTLEKLVGVRLNDFEGLDQAGIDKAKIVRLGVMAFFKAVMLDGIFHGDLHAGNLFVLEGNRLGIIDFGIVGRLSEKSRRQLANMVLALLSEDYEMLCYQYAELASSDTSINFESFQRDVQNAISPYIGLLMSEVNSGRVLIDATKVATRYNIRVPGEWMLVFKSILTLEGLGRQLDPEFDILELGQDMAKELIKNQYSITRLRKDFLWSLNDIGALIKILPRQVRWMIRKFNSNDFAFEIKVPGLEKVNNQLDTNGKRVSTSVLIAGLLIAGSMTMNSMILGTILGFPTTSFLLFSGAILFIVRFLFL